MVGARVDGARERVKESKMGQPGVREASGRVTERDKGKASGWKVRSKNSNARNVQEGTKAERQREGEG